MRPLPLFRRGLGVVAYWHQSLLPTRFVILMAGAFAAYNNGRRLQSSPRRRKSYWDSSLVVRFKPSIRVGHLYLGRVRANEPVNRHLPVHAGVPPIASP